MRWVPDTAAFWPNSFSVELVPEKVFADALVSLKRPQK
jgi:hypothetical protein